MHNYLPVLIVGTIIGVFTLLFIVVYLAERKRKEAAENRSRLLRQLLRSIVFLFFLFSYYASSAARATGILPLFHRR